MKTIEQNDDRLSRMAAFVTRLAEDPFAHDAFSADPDAALAQAGLAPADLGRLLLEGAATDFAGGAWAACQTCSDPGPDEYPGDDHERSDS